MFYWLLFSSQTWSLKKIDNTCGKTIIRAWHELHSIAHLPHDFIDLLAPSKDIRYIACIRHDEIRAIAACEQSLDSDKTSNSKLIVQRIAYPPYQNDVPPHFISLLHKANIPLKYINFKRHQPLYYCESLYQLDNSTIINDTTLSQI